LRLSANSINKIRIRIKRYELEKKSKERPVDPGYPGSGQKNGLDAGLSRRKIPEKITKKALWVSQVHSKPCSFVSTKLFEKLKSASEVGFKYFKQLFLRCALPHF
jgi:hypothetical protein